MSQWTKFKAVHSVQLQCRSVPKEVLDLYRGQLPEPLIEFWVEEGWCGYSDGLFWLVNPLDFDDILKDWLGAHFETAIALARTAFGDVLFWFDEKVYYLDVLYGRVTLTVPKHIEILFEYVLCKDSYLDDVIGRKVFQEALPNLGIPAYDECYAFVPALALGGSYAAENLKKVKLREHLAILRQLVEVELVE
jgi:hypothetical protein